MRNKIVLRITSVAAAALVCAVWSLAGCSAIGGGDGDDNQKNADLPELSELSLAYEGTEKNLLEGFLPENESYTVNIALADGGKTVVVTAAAKDGVSVEISADGIIVSDGKVAAPGLGKPNVVIDIVVGGTEGRKYSIELSAPQTSNDSINTIKSLFVSYSENEAGLIGAVSGTQWSLYTLRGKTTAMVKVEATSNVSPIQILVNKQKLAESEGNVSLLSIALPALGSKTNVEIEIVIFKKAGYQNGLGDSKTYTVTFKPPMLNSVTWTGTAEYMGASGYVITSVMAQTSGNDLANAQLLENLEEPKIGRVWRLVVDELYRPSYFTVLLEKSVAVPSGDVDENGHPVMTVKFEQRQTGAYYLDAAQLAAKEGIELLIEDKDTGIYINNANDFVKYLGSNENSNASYALGNSIDLSTYTDNNGVPVAWNGPVGYAGKFYGNGHTISNLIIDPPNAKKNFNNHATVALFNAIRTGAYLENFTVKVSSRNQDKDGTNDTLYFGGVVGEVAKISDWTTTSPPATIKNVTVTGELRILNWPANTNIGGIVGVVENGGLIIENCVTDIAIELINGDSANGFNSFGGLIGTACGTTTIRNSYARGDIKIKNVGDKMIRVGGLLGTAWTNGASNIGYLTIENSYATGTIIADVGNRSAWTSGREVGAGGLVGVVYASTSLTIRNSVALNPSVLALTQNSSPTTIIGNGVPRAGYGRLVGSKYSTSGTVTTTGNKARSGMLTGYAEPGAEEVLTGDDTTVCEYDALKTIAPWLELGFYEAVWDFSRISEGKGPTLK